MVLTVTWCDNISGTKIGVEREIDMTQSRQDIKDVILYITGQMLYGIEVQTVPHAFNTDDVFAQISDTIADSFDNLTASGLKTKSNLCSAQIDNAIICVNIEKSKLISTLKIK
jgi:hypothetical protein